jgi:hypothetical protein
MSRVVLLVQPTIPMSELAKAFLASDRAAIVIDNSQLATVCIWLII